MLDSKSYYDAFPDEDASRPKMLVSNELLGALAALEKEFREQIEQFRRADALPNAPAASEQPDGSVTP